MSYPQPQPICEADIVFKPTALGIKTRPEIRPVPRLTGLPANVSVRDAAIEAAREAVEVGGRVAVDNTPLDASSWARRGAPLEPENNDDNEAIAEDAIT